MIAGVLHVGDMQHVDSRHAQHFDHTPSVSSTMWPSQALERIDSTGNGMVLLGVASGAMMSDIMTAEELERVDIPGKSTELVRGRLVVREPPFTYHGRVQSNLHILVGSYVRAHKRGDVF